LGMPGMPGMGAPEKEPGMFNLGAQFSMGDKEKIYLLGRYGPNGLQGSGKWRIDLKQASSLTLNGNLEMSSVQAGAETSADLLFGDRLISAKFRKETGGSMAGASYSQKVGLSQSGEMILSSDLMHTFGLGTMTQFGANWRSKDKRQNAGALFKLDGSMLLLLYLKKVKDMSFFTTFARTPDFMGSVTTTTTAGLSFDVKSTQDRPMLRYTASVDSGFKVLSKVDLQLPEGFRVGLSTSLDHLTSDYQFGLSFGLG